MNLTQLLQFYTKSAIVQSLDDFFLNNPDSSFSIDSLKGDVVGFILKSLSNKSLANSNHFFIVNNPEEAIYLYNCLQNIFTEKQVFYFPAEFSNIKMSSSDATHIYYRNELLQQLNNNFFKIIITYPASVIQKTETVDFINEHEIKIEINSIQNMWQLKELLEKYQFEQVNFVEIPGQFSIRGSIMDVYSYSATDPYRIVWNNEEIAIIKIFNVESQQSLKNIDTCTIMPDFSRSKTTKLISLFELFSTTQKSFFWVKNLAQLFVELKLILQQIILFCAENQEQNYKYILDFEKIKNNLLRQMIIEYQAPNYFSKIFNYSTAILPNWNRDFANFSQTCLDWLSNKFQLFIFYEQLTQVERLEQIILNQNYSFSFHKIPYKISQGFIDNENKIICLTDHEILLRYYKPKLINQYHQAHSLNIKELMELKPGDFVVHTDYGIGKFSGLQKLNINGNTQEVVRLVYDNNDLLYVSIHSLYKINKYCGAETKEPNLHNLSSNQWLNSKEKAKKEIKKIAFDLIKLYAKRKSEPGFAFSPDNQIQIQMESAFPFEETADQLKSISEVKLDMQSKVPMDRLICGDVGFGKTEIAIRAAFKAILDKKQVAILTPTTILALQHFKTFHNRLNSFGVTIDFLNRFRTVSQKKDIYSKVEAGKIDLIIGTIALLSKNVKFKDLGLLIIDEEHKFGVAQKEIIKNIKTNVDTLTLTATPIPRTLQFSLMGARDLSIINTPPTHRQPIHTEIISFKDSEIKNLIYQEINRGGQVFFVQNKISGMTEMVSKLQKICPDLNIVMAHGQMDGRVLEKKLLDFIEHKYDIFVSTNIIESGIDIPNVNSIFIHDAHHFGLSDLHQLRGRVGRSNKKAYCYLLVPNFKYIKKEHQKKLEVLIQYSNLGSGFQISLRDLDFRGAGNILGAEQSGFISDLGIETFHKILNQTILELKKENFELYKNDRSITELDFKTDCTIETDEEIFIPSDYISFEKERWNIYNKLNDCLNFEQLHFIKKELIDRFGTIPQPLENLFLIIQIKILAQELKIEKILLKNNLAKCFFTKNSDFYKSHLFDKFLQFIHQKNLFYRLKQYSSGFFVEIDNIKNIEILWVKISEIHTNSIS